MQATADNKRKGFGIQLLVIVLAYIISRVIFMLFSFDYNVFRDSLDPVKLAIDFGVWVAVYFVVSKLVEQMTWPADR